MNIGEQRRTIYVEPIEEPEAWPIEARTQPGTCGAGAGRSAARRRPGLI